MSAMSSKLTSTTKNRITELARQIRYNIVRSTTEAGSGHPTTSLSATDLMSTLFFGGFFRADLKKPAFPNNDRLIFSKGHASPLLYALYAAAGTVSEKELMSLRKIDSTLEGHPSMNWKYTEAATGSLGQGLSIGVGMALNAAAIDKLPYRTWVLMGDSEMAEGSVWEAMQVATYYKLDNLIGILDVNRLGQRGQTMYGHKVAEYEKRIAAFGWKTIVVDGHDVRSIFSAYNRALAVKGRPVMIIARTLKGKGVKFVENKDGWHGVAIPKDKLEKALDGLGKVNLKLVGKVKAPLKKAASKIIARRVSQVKYDKNVLIATRRAYGNALKRLYPANPNMVVLDAETSNSTYANIFGNEYPERFFEMFIAEQNMTGVALGMSRRGKLPFVSSFAAFLSRAHDQIRMSQYTGSAMVVCGSHAGVSIGPDGPSQMALEDIAMFRSMLGSWVLYPSDAISCEKLVEQLTKRKEGVSYIRTTRAATPILYKATEKFPVGGCKVLKRSPKDKVTILAAGITVHEALKAWEILKQQKINVRVIDLYSVKPIDGKTIRKAANETKSLITVEDHFREGGLAEAVRGVFHKYPATIYSLSVRKMPRSGNPAQLMDLERISADAIVTLVKKVVKGRK